ncbi:MAG: hypothetical protein KC912_21080 [Proteobacteria bacterium]|nr:hypothetical protein [Pseudomonadota bacterium]
MIPLLLATLALADLAPPPDAPPPPTCDAQRCPDGTPETFWCVTTMGKSPECPESDGWTRACREKSGRNMRHLMCKPVPEADAAPSVEAVPPASESGGPCSTSPGGSAPWTVALVALFARRRLRVGTGPRCA